MDNIRKNRLNSLWTEMNPQKSKEPVAKNNIIACQERNVVCKSDDDEHDYHYTPGASR